MLRLFTDVAKRCPGQVIPDDYLVVDTETTGIDTTKDHILQLGLCFVHDRKPIASMAQYLKRPNLSIHKKASDVHGITLDKIEHEGIEPKYYIPQVVDIFMDWRSKGRMFAGHNLMAFDAPLIERETAGVGIPFKFGDNEIIDTGMLVKAAQLGMYMRPEETLRSFWVRVSQVIAKGIYWSLDRHCYTAYNLTKYGLSLDKAHDAEADCRLSHFLLEELRLIAAQEAIK